MSNILLIWLLLSISGFSIISAAVSGYANVNTFLINSTVTDCYKSHNAGWFIALGTGSGAALNADICTTLNNAKKSGISNVDVAFFPSPTCDTKLKKDFSCAADSLNKLVEFIASNCKSSWSGGLWILVTNSQVWYTVYGNSWYLDNQNYFKKLVDTCKSQNIRCGVKSDSTQWRYIFNDAKYTYGKDLPLWSTSAGYGGWISTTAVENSPGTFYEFSPCGEAFTGDESHSLYN